MSAVPVAAFDPVFWLHHCNIDRIFHLWQTVNPSNWFRQKDEEVEFSPQRELIPFHASDDRYDFYNSNRVRQVDALNYSYDYVDEITDKDGDTVPEKSHVYINKLYGPKEDCFNLIGPELDPVINVIYNRYVREASPHL